MKFLQLNLGRGKEAQNILMQAAGEKRADVLLTSQQHKWSENSAWYQDTSRRAGILVCNPDLSIADFLETDAGSFGWRWWGYVCKAATFLPTTLSRSLRPRSSSLRKASKMLEGGPLLRATSIVSRPSGEKPIWTRGESWSVRWSPGMTDCVESGQGFYVQTRSARGGGGRLSTSRLPRPVLPQG